MERSGRMVLLRESEGSKRSARIEVWVEAGRVGRVVAGGRVDMMGWRVVRDDVRCWRREACKVCHTWQMVGSRFERLAGVEMVAW